MEIIHPLALLPSTSADAATVPVALSPHRQPAAAGAADAHPTVLVALLLQVSAAVALVVALVVALAKVAAVKAPRAVAVPNVVVVPRDPMEIAKPALSMN